MLQLFIISPRILYFQQAFFNHSIQHFIVFLPAIIRIYNVNVVTNVSTDNTNVKYKLDVCDYEVINRTEHKM